MSRAWMAGRDSAFLSTCYLDKINSYSRLSADEEGTLPEAIRNGDAQARARMISGNLRLVVRIARDFLGRGLSLDDLVGEGNLGLIRAAQDYDPAFGTRFSTYASHWIRQAIRQALIETAATIRLPAHMVGLLTKWQRAEKTLRRELDHEPTFDEIAQTIGLTATQKVMVAQAFQSKKVRLDADRGAHDGDTPLYSEAADPYPTPYADVEMVDAFDEVLSRLERLDERERLVVSLHYGLSGAAPLTLKEIGRRLGVTREWVRKIEMRALRKLNNQHREHGSYPRPATRVPVERAAGRYSQQKTLGSLRECVSLER